MYRVNNNYVIKEIEDGILLIDITNEENIFQFNYIGKLIINNLHMRKEELIKMITNEYNVDEKEISDDYDAFINNLLENDIVR